MTEERVLYENSELNNCNLKAIYSETNQEIYLVFTSVPSALDSTAIMFAAPDMSREITQSPIQLGTVKSISSFPDITQFNGVILTIEEQLICKHFLKLI